jgi:hypothetical protein
VQTIHTSVLARRTTITSDFATLPHEAGWANEAVFFVQAEGDHPALSISSEISPDGIAWAELPARYTLPETDTIIAIPLTTFGNWLRININGASEPRPARVLVHLVLTG